MANRNEKLMKKVETLIEKLDGETNPLKRAVYTIQLEHLEARFQKEIDIIDIKEKYGQERAERTEEARSRIKGNTTAKFNKINLRDKYQKEIDSLADYDPDSPSFAFADELRMADGDIETLISELRENGNSEIADKIQQTLDTKENFQTTADELDELKGEGSKIQRETIVKNVGSTVKESALVVSKKANIFQRAFNSIRSGVQEFNASRKSNKEFKKETKSINAYLEKNKQNELENLEAEYQEMIRQFENRKQQIIGKYNSYHSSASQRENFKHNVRNDEAAERAASIVKDYMDRQPVQEIEESQNDGQEPEDL